MGVSLLLDHVPLYFLNCVLFICMCSHEYLYKYMYRPTSLFRPEEDFVCVIGS